MKPLRISNRLTLEIADGQAVVITKAEIHPVEIFMIVDTWIRENPMHPRCEDAELWLSEYEGRYPHARPPKPPSKETREWIEDTIRHYRKHFAMSEDQAKKIIVAMRPELKVVLTQSDQ